MTRDSLDFSIVLPSQAPHLAYLELIRRALGLAMLAATPIVIAAGLLASITPASPPWLSSTATMIFLVGVSIFVAVFLLLTRAARALAMVYEQWQLNQEAERITRLAGSIEISVSGRNNTVNLTQQATTTTENTLIVESPARTRAKFLRHVQEFNLQIPLRGTTRSGWLLADGAGVNYQFSDGDTISREEYDTIVKFLVMAGVIRNRRQGRTGDTPPYSAAPVAGWRSRLPTQPTQVTQANQVSDRAGDCIPALFSFPGTSDKINMRFPER